MTNWDGQWYRVIAEEGYPRVLPRVGHGGIDMNPWAFFPVFPLAVRAIMTVTGLPFVVVGPLLSTLIGFAAMFLLFKLIDQAVGRWEAIVAVVATCFYIASPVFSAAYTESAALLLVVAILLLLRARRYWWVAVLLVVLSLTRQRRHRHGAGHHRPRRGPLAPAATKALTRSACVGGWRRWRPGPGCSTLLWPTIVSDRDADPGRVQPDHARLEHPDEGQALHVVEPALRPTGASSGRASASSPWRPSPGSCCRSTRGAGVPRSGAGPGPIPATSSS